MEIEETVDYEHAKSGVYWLVEAPPRNYTAACRNVSSEVGGRCAYLHTLHPKEY